MALAGEVWTIKRLLEWTAGYFTRKSVDSPRLSAELLLSHVLQAPRIKLYTDYERILGDDQLKSFRSMVQRAGEHEPIAYLTGRAHFFSMEFEVNRDVLIPRPETEVLVENVLQFFRNASGFESPRVLDLCTGSGCIACAVGKHLPTSTVLATDVSEKALAVAKRNIEANGLSDRVRAAQGDLFDPLASEVDRTPYHFILANPPYIPTGQIESLDKNVKDYEPRLALDGGLDGLVPHRRILAEGAKFLVPGGRMFLEIAFDQGQSALGIARDHKEYDDARILKDFGGRDRILTVRRVTG